MGQAMPRVDFANEITDIATETAYQIEDQYQLKAKVVAPLLFDGFLDYALQELEPQVIAKMLQGAMEEIEEEITE